SGQTAVLPAGTLGYEWGDEAVDNGFVPPGLIKISSATVNVSPLYLQDYGSNYGSGTGTHSLTFYKHKNGSLVFWAGTVQWAWGLDNVHDISTGTADVRIQQATVNLFADMGIQPSTLQSGVILASPSTDVIPPASSITSPVNGSAFQSGQQIVISGTASD